MKRILIFTFLTLFLVEVMTNLSTVYSDHTPAPTSVTVAGSIQSELGCPGDWQPDCAVTYLSYDTNDDVWQKIFSLPAGAWEYKAALNNSWDENYGAHATQDGPNIPLSLSELTDVKFYYDHKTHWVTDNQNSIIPTAPGSFQSAIGCSADWDPACLRSWLQDPDGDGNYSFSTSDIPAGNYEVKVAHNESWDESYGEGGVQDGPNIPFTVPADCTVMHFIYDPVTHTLTIDGETDIDCDGIVDSEDNCPNFDNEDQTDSDDDGAGNVCDNCWEIPNPDQSDSDGDCIPPYLEDPLCGDKCETADSDGDGIPDSEDSCPDSNLDDTIVIDLCDSRIDNKLFEDGCTMRDLIAGCEDDAKNHGNFVSCVAHLTNDWKKEGHISGSEKGAIQRCAARSDIPSTTTTIIIPSECTLDEECDDGVYCNGAETCDVGTGLCHAGIGPCPDDELFCNGEESCDEASNTCKHAGNPCKSGFTCDEDDDVCVGCSIDEDCDDGLYCNGAETCDIGSTICQTGTEPCQEDEICIEETDKCMPESLIPTIELIPDSAWRSSLIPLPLIMVITGNNTNFNTTTTVDFSGDEVLPSWHIVLSPTDILVVSLIKPADSEDTEVIVTVISTVDTDEEVATAALTLNLIPWF
jgi:hypothetical protein